MPDSSWWEKVAADRDSAARLIRLAIRVFVNGVKQSEERIQMDMDKLDELLPVLAEQHADMMAGKPGMVEIEFVDELNPETRFFRMGTDPRGMVHPVQVDLSSSTADILSKWGGSKRHGR